MGKEDGTRCGSQTLREEIEQLESPDPQRGLDVLLERGKAAEAEALERGHVSLAHRARLVQADALIRSGRTASGGRLAREVNRAADSSGDRYLQARAAVVMARFFRYLGNRQALLEYAVASVERLPDDAPALVRFDHELMLGIALAMMRSYDSARRQFARVRELMAEHGTVTHRIGILNNSAYAEYEAGNIDGALTLAEEMMALAESASQVVQPLWLETLGRIHLAAGRPQEAKAVLLQASDPSVTGAASDGDAVPIAWLTLAEALRTLGEVEEAHDVLQRCLTASAARGLKEVHARAQQELATLLAAQGRWAEAYGQHVAFYTEWQEVSATERDAHARIIQAVYETTEARAESERYRELSMLDALTDLANRRYLQERLPVLLDEAHREHVPLAVALVDLDHFKTINDTFSHEAGDQVLTRVGRILSAHAGDGFAARLGGEEFLLVLPKTDRDGALTRCEEVRDAIATSDWTAISGTMRVTASLGLALYEGDQLNPDELLRAADEALYAAKRGGRNRVVVADG